MSRGVRSADVRADEPVVCYALPMTELERLGEERPDVKLVLLENLLANASATVARLTVEVATLAQ